jgi:2-oxoglutarate dehydrogenase E2 component (dihydrolipoamide succinyltransferase)
MALVNLIMPKLGESIMEATILKWHKRPGDAIKEDETVLDIATDKVDSEVPSTTSGVIEEILFKENDVVPIGTIIATIRIGSPSSIIQSQPPTSVSQPHYEEAGIIEKVPFQPVDSVKSSMGNGASVVRFYSPLVLNIAQQEGISMLELENIPGTGQEGRVSKKDILHFVAVRNGTGSGNIQISDKKTEQLTKVNENTNQEVVVSSSPQPPMIQNFTGNIEIIEITTNNSIKVKPRAVFLGIQ